jgi:hypothetical protein
MAHVFISYSHKDKDYAHKLADELKRWGIDAWIDDRIDYGSQWPRVIQESLDACPGFIVIMSSNSYNSEWVQNEVSYAQANKQVMFPILLNGKTWVSFAAKQYADVRNGEMPTNKYFETIRKQLGLQVSHIKPENAVRAKPSDAQQLNDGVVDHILKKVRNGSNGEWEIGLFRIGYYVPQKNPPKWMKVQSYTLNSKVINTDLLRRYDSKAYWDYMENEEKITKKEGSTPAMMKNLQEFADAHIKLRERLNLQVYKSSQTVFSEVDINNFVKKLIDIHKAHNIPVSEIKIKVIK